MVEALWSEWTVGLRGGPAIADLDGRWGSRWRAGRQNELQCEEAAMHIVNLQQQQTGCSLDLFCKQLRANRKAKVVQLKR
ncbi:transcriptional activator of glycolytic enzymes domain-containing protein [Hirsutella rhossiliensis]